jgi:hypothetical protein
MFYIFILIISYSTNFWYEILDCLPCQVSIRCRTLASTKCTVLTQMSYLKFLAHLGDPIQSWSVRRLSSIRPSVRRPSIRLSGVRPSVCPASVHPAVCLSVRRPSVNIGGTFLQFEADVIHVGWLWPLWGTSTCMQKVGHCDLYLWRNNPKIGKFQHFLQHLVALFVTLRYNLVSYSQYQWYGIPQFAYQNLEISII